jgi:hypothetical protein
MKSLARPLPGKSTESKDRQAMSLESQFSELKEFATKESV